MQAISGKLVERIYLLSRDIMIVMLLVIGLVLACLTINGITVIHDLRSAGTKLQDAEHISGVILLADEKLSMSARLAAATGEEAWIERYEAEISVMDMALQRALALADPTTAASFEQQTQLANSRLVELELKSFELVRAGQSQAAWQVLSSNEYADYKSDLSNGTLEFVSALGNQQAQAIEQLAFQSTITALGLSFASFLGIGTFGLWRLKRGRTVTLEAEVHLRDLALTDADSGLPNRHGLLAVFSGIDKEQRDAIGVEIVTVHIGDMQSIDDALGHGHVDHAIAAVASNISRSADAAELFVVAGKIARTGPLELSMLLARQSGEDSRNQAMLVIAQAANEPITLSGLTFDLNAKLGVARFPEDADTIEELLSCSTLASHAQVDEVDDARDLADQRYNDTKTIWFSPKLRSRASSDATFRDDLRRAVRDECIQANFQPVYDLKAGIAAGFEVLARWNRGDQGFVPPDQFIPVIEDMGLAQPFTNSMLRQALDACHRLPNDVWVAVNVSPGLLQSDGLIDDIQNALRQANLSAERLEIELTETALLANAGWAHQTMKKLQDIGASVALDDFGTGYSSLSYLCRFPINKIKLDRSFLNQIDENPKVAVVTRQVIELGKSLDMSITAEGVETPDQVDMLKSWTCRYAQGYHYSRPVPVEQINQDWFGPNRHRNSSQTSTSISSLTH